MDIIKAVATKGAWGPIGPSPPISIAFKLSKIKKYV